MRVGGSRSWRLVLAVAALAVVVATGSATGAGSARAGHGGTLLFSRDGAIWTARGDGTHERVVVRRKLNPDGGDLAADADRMVFRGRPSRPDAKRRLYVQSVDGTDRKRLKVDGYYPKLSPDGRTVIFGNFSAHRERLYTAPVAGGPKTEVLESLGGDNDEASFAPDGRIIFAHIGDDEAAPNGIYTADGDGANPQPLGALRLSPVPAPSYSPDGQQITLAAYRKQSIGGGGPDVWTMGSDGSSPVDLTSSESFDSFPVFSPTGARIAWLIEGGDPHVSTHQDLWVMNSDGSDKHLLIKGLEFDSIAWR